MLKIPLAMVCYGYGNGGLGLLVGVGKLGHMGAICLMDFRFIIMLLLRNKTWDSGVFRSYPGFIHCDYNNVLLLTVNFNFIYYSIYFVTSKL